MSSESQPTPEQRAEIIAEIRRCHAQASGSYHWIARTQVGYLLAEIDRLTAALSDRDEAARLNAEEHLETLRQLADEREDHNRATEGLGRAVIELREAAEAREKAEQLARAYQQTLEERTAERDAARDAGEVQWLYERIESCTHKLDAARVERDQARRELAAARPKAGEVFVRGKVLRHHPIAALSEVEIGLMVIWVVDSAIVSPPPEAEPGEKENA